MKTKHGTLGLLLLLALAACQGRYDDPVETQNLASQQPIVSEELQAVDSLMWQQPDSALALLLPWFDTCGDAMLASPKDPAGETALETHSMRLYNRHYAHLLLAELLYKNDYAQANREALLDAVAYFDSLVRQAPPTPPLKGGRGDSRHTPQNPTDNLVFLSARAHYINGVGYYEQDSVVEACEEYIRALETMENHFEEADIMGHRARFMAYTYNRLGDMFSEQFMMESAVQCYEGALVYCKIEPTSPQGVSNILFRIGQQYDMDEKKDKAREYYGMALEEMPSSESISYRDLATLKALSDYRVGEGIEQSLNVLRQIVTQADDESERLTRFMAIGDIFYEEGMYDSALFYLEPVYYYSKDRLSQIQAAEFLRVIYDSIGDRENLNQCLRFLAIYKQSDGQNKAMVSRLEDTFNGYRDQKQGKQVESERAKAVKKAMSVIIPIAVSVVFIIVLLLMQRSKRLLKKQQAESDRKLGETEQEYEMELRLWQAEAERTLKDSEKKHKEEMEDVRKTHQKEQETLWRSLRQREKRMEALEKALYMQRDNAEQQRVSFLEESICRKINNSVRSLHVTARDGSRKNVALCDEDAVALREAVLSHYPSFESVLMGKNPKMGKNDMLLCQLYLLGLDERQIAVLQCKSYSAIKKRAKALEKSLGIDEKLSDYLLKNSSFQETPQA